MEEDREDLITALNTTVKELQQGIDMHCCLLVTERSLMSTPMVLKSIEVPAGQNN
jgi:hypothetical protein